MLYTNTKHEEMKKEAFEAIIENLENGYSGYYCDLHNEVFNTDYYIIGTYEAKKALEEYGVFEAIEKVQNYENFNFGKIYTDISNPEKLVNMLFYIIGEEAISKMYETEAFNDNYNNYADEENNKKIIEEMKANFNID